MCEHVLGFCDDGKCHWQAFDGVCFQKGILELAFAELVIGSQ